MASDEADQAEGARRRNSEEAELSDRLRRLEERLGAAEAEKAAEEVRNAPKGSDTSGLGAALRLSTEFIAAIASGAILGWVADRVLGTSPWGFIILLMLGFAAGIVGIMRSAGMLGEPPGRKK